MKVAVYSDCHLDAPHEVPLIKDEIFDPTFVKAKHEVDEVVLTGDIIDVDNCKRSKLGITKAKVERLKKAYGPRYVLGNHECEKPQKYYYKDDETKTLFIHGHTIFYSEKKLRRWENKKGGMKYWRYKIYQWTHHSGRNGKPWKAKKEDVEMLVEMAKAYRCKNIVFGHTHRVYDSTHDGVRIINVPKGLTILEL